MMENKGISIESKMVYSPEKVAEIMEVKKSFVMRLLREGQLKGIKMGKFWRVPEKYLNEYFANCDQNGTGKSQMSVDTKNKIRFHANLKSQHTVPETVEKLERTILELKDKLQHQTVYKRVATIAKFQSAITVREELKAKLDSMPAILDEIGSKAYPELINLVDKDADSLEALFVKDASGKKRMVDYIDKGALKMVGDGAEGEKQKVKSA